MSPDDSFIVGDGGGTVMAWDVVKDGDQYDVQMRWRSINGQLALESACVQDVEGLSDLNRRLLEQRGATGEPSVPLREAGKKVMTMASVVSKLKSLSSNTETLDPSLTSPAISFTSHSEQTEQAMDNRDI
jgi:hypothetical protein